jgi:hypothetical protein
VEPQDFLGPIEGRRSNPAGRVGLRPGRLVVSLRVGDALHRIDGNAVLGSDYAHARRHFPVRNDWQL